MVNKDVYRSAVGKVKASDEFKARVMNSLDSLNANKGKYGYRQPLLGLAVLLIIVCISAAAFPSMYGLGGKTNSGSDFKITGTSSGDAMASYISILYLDGYYYKGDSLSWYRYSLYAPSKEEYEKIKGEKIGEVKLDLKGMIYTGTPPDFSSTHNVGSEIYTIKNVKKERAVLLFEGNNGLILYREGKALSDDKTPINLKVSDVFNMQTDSAEVASVELRSRQDGSWMRSSEDSKLIGLINSELPNLPLLRSSALGQDPYASDSWVSFNLIFKDGTPLNMQFFPDIGYASLFNGYIRLSPELADELKQLSSQGELYPSISDLLPYKEDDVMYLKFKDYRSNEEVLCNMPKWSRMGFFSIFDFYHVAEVQEPKARSLVITCTLGKTEADSTDIGFYETDDKGIAVKIDGHFYKPFKGQITYKELYIDLHNCTELGD